MEDWDAFADANDVEADDAEWATVSKLASASTNERVRCAALRCLGRAARRRAAKKMSNPDADDADRAVAEMSSLVALVRAGASPERPEDTRRAAAVALASSGRWNAFRRRSTRPIPRRSIRGPSRARRV